MAELLFTGSGYTLDTVFDLYAGRKKTSDAIVKGIFYAHPLCGLFLKGAERRGTGVCSWRGRSRKLGDPGSCGDLSDGHDKVLRWSAVPGEAAGSSACMGVCGPGDYFCIFKGSGSLCGDLPGELLDKEIVEYPAARAEGCPVSWSVCSSHEEEFHEEELKPVYKGIYVRQKLLFSRARS